MLRSSSLICTFAVIVFCASAGLATPSVNGTVVNDEYSLIIDDNPAEPGYTFSGTGLDIDTMQFDNDVDWSYLALTVVNEPIDTNGGDTSFLGASVLAAVFYDDDLGTSPTYFLQVYMQGSAYGVELDEWNGVGWQAVSLGGGDYDVAVSKALELRLDSAKFDLTGQAYVRAQLDDTGLGHDDQIEGLIPEPATLILLGLAFPLLRRRRR